MSATKLTALALVAALAAPGSLQAQQSFGRGNPLSSIFRCDAEGNKQGTAAVIGGVVGGAVGNQLSKKDRALGTVLGAALGAAAGCWLAMAASVGAMCRRASSRWSVPRPMRSLPVRAARRLTRPWPPETAHQRPDAIRLAKTAPASGSCRARAASLTFSHP